jgi:hypothetical protein
MKLILLNVITWIYEYKSFNSLFCSFLHSRYLTSVRPKYSSQHPFINHP